MDYIVLDIPTSQIMRIKHLWEELNKIHLADSVNFKDHYQSFTFENRIKSLLKIEEDKIRITVIQKGNECFGYCLSTIQDSKGEIESLFISDTIRNKKYGKLLVDKHIEWMKENDCEKITVTVSHGHESVLDFYHKLGFFERLISLEYKK